ncbi:tyrosine-type recombinase/integrase [Terasakiella sp.]|uniref:tyrosine-type recombinase/integrase n=1 Tax=Terasakiella sp. TaxID=2034861 RepID=UPI003AA9C86E
MSKLTASKVKSISAPGRHADGNGLYLVVTPAGSKSWLYRFQLDLRRRDMGLGSVDLVSLKDARLARNEAQRLVASGVDPIAHAKAGRSAASGRTFADAIDEYIAAHEKSWKNNKHRQQWRNTMETYVKPVMGHRRPDEVRVDDVLAILSPHWADKHETASRVRGRIENVFDYCKARGWAKGDNPARMRGHLDKLLPKASRVKSVVHLKAMPYADAPDFAGSLLNDHDRAISVSALLFAILTAARTGEVIGARRSELDLTAGVWNIPAERMKSGIAHRVPLSDAARRLISQLPGLPGRGDDFLFPGRSNGCHISDMAMLKALNCRGFSCTVHGFRSTFRDWAAETTAYPNEVVEMALAHTIKSSTEKAYRRGDMLDRRRPLMQDWADYLGGVRGTSAKVRQLIGDLTQDQVKELSALLGGHA